jgi:phenylalanyl-tRNA synthetase beta chain
MKFTPSWLREHLDTTASVQEIADAMTMAGLEVEGVEDASAKLAPFTAARSSRPCSTPTPTGCASARWTRFRAAGDRLRRAQRRAGLVTVFARSGPTSRHGITLEPRPVRGVVSNGMLCSAAELELSAESDGILELDPATEVGAPAPPSSARARD